MILHHREVEAKDLPLIAKFPRNARELFFMHPTAVFPLTKEQLTDAIAQRECSTVVLQEKVPVAFANIYDWHQGGSCSIGNVAVSAGYRGRGVGQYLITTMINKAIESFSAREVRVWCHSTNTNALLMYHKLGFLPDSMKTRVDFEGKRVVILGLGLKL
ncbi:GNAT family N-acetyltransferase [Dethiosulfatarculus sandiegensis]|uniref:GNAT family acetyltransferase n=1 Tax=Dethiosulfatarculus sandiegensis TaxID=1429043 RepID=A0A0D2GBI1_9BACT|nr:GNAT family N-acetyltransferase [Dethiosulfatarculus sandiegensis]KIX12232.1 GNAT family acetyltransferase [Dethiosulfatarculus sandiegensis]